VSWEDPEVPDAGCCKSEEQHLKGRNCSHQDGLNRIVDAGMGDSQLFGHRHHRSADHQNLDPGEVIFAPLHQGRPRVGKDELAGNEENQDIHEARQVPEEAGIRTSDMRCSRPACEFAIGGTCGVSCHYRLSRERMCAS